ncbi:MAG: response regulator [Chthoniobacterales bacterium]|nr:response regulator [Chthoniobacterales bacterium]
MKIALVDDSVFSRNQVSKILKELIPHNLEIVPFTGGAPAIEAIPSGNFDLVLLDLVMPPPDGFETLKALREKGYKGHIWVCTADIQGTSKERCIALGANGYLEKPFSREKTAIAIETVIREQEKQKDNPKPSSQP